MATFIDKLTGKPIFIDAKKEINIQAENENGKLVLFKPAPSGYAYIYTPGENGKTWETAYTWCLENYMKVPNDCYCCLHTFTTTYEITWNCDKSRILGGFIYNTLIRVPAHWREENTILNLSSNVGAIIADTVFIEACGCKNIHGRVTNSTIQGTMEGELTLVNIKFSGTESIKAAKIVSSSFSLQKGSYLYAREIVYSNISAHNSYIYVNSLSNSFIEHAKELGTIDKDLTDKNGVIISHPYLIIESSVVNNANIIQEIMVKNSYFSNCRISALYLGQDLATIANTFENCEMHWSCLNFISHFDNLRGITICIYPFTNENITIAQPRAPGKYRFIVPIRYVVGTTGIHTITLPPTDLISNNIEFDESIFAIEINLRYRFSRYYCTYQKYNLEPGMSIDYIY